jgi:Polyketide cyclase / dehydrase and lipid transport
MTRYSFLSTWVLRAPIDEVWDAIYEVKDWPQWWRGVRRVDELVHVDGGVGSRYAHVWRSRLPYDLSFELEVTRVERPYLLEGVAKGELVGDGRWRLFEGQATAVTYEWNVGTTIRWMNALAPVGRPFFGWNHDHVMRNGAHGLSSLLAAPLLLSD